MKIEIAEAGPSSGYPDALKIYVGDDWTRAKRCGPGVKVAIHAAQCRDDNALKLIDEFIAADAFDTNPSGKHDLILLYDPGQTTEAMALLDLVKARFK